MSSLHSATQEIVRPPDLSAKSAMLREAREFIVWEGMQSVQALSIGLVERA